MPRKDLASQVLLMIDSLNIPVTTKNQLRSRANDELQIIKEHKLQKLLVPTIHPDRPTLEEVIENEDYSIVAHLTQSLYYTQKKNGSVKINSVKEFLDRVQATGGKINEKQIRELILAGCFGSLDEGETGGDGKDYIGSEDEGPCDYGYEKACRLLQHPTLSLHLLEQRTSKKINTYEEVCSSLSQGNFLRIAGTLTRKPHDHKCSNGKMMAFLNLNPVDAEEDDVLDVVVWPEAHDLLKELSIETGSLVLVRGKRGYNQKKQQGQLEIGKGGSIEVLDIRDFF